MHYVIDYLQRNWLNYILFFLMAAGAFQLQHIPPEAVLLVRLLPYALLGIALGMAVLFNKSKLFFTLSLSMIGLLVLSANQAENRFFDLMYFSAGLLIPINSAALSFSQEKGIFSASGKLKMALIGLQMLAVLYCLLFQEAWLSGLRNLQLLPRDVTRLLEADDLVALLFLSFMGYFIIKDFFKRDSNLSLKFFSLTTLFLAFLRPNDVLWYSLFMTGNALYHLLTLIRKSYMMAYVDDLTGVPGRRALNEDLLKLSGHYAIAMVDIDHFKQFNDKHGHDVGDEALRHVARTIRKALRGGRLYRFGGEEFTVLYPGFDLGHALINLEEIRRAVETEPLVSRIQSGRAAGGRKLPVTISLGVAEKAPEETAAIVLKKADRALYTAKEKGRNRVSH